MLMRRVSAKDKIPNGLLRGTAVAGLVSGLAAASLGAVRNGLRNVHRDQRHQHQLWRRRGLPRAPSATSRWG